MNNRGSEEEISIPLLLTYALRGITYASMHQPMPDGRQPHPCNTYVNNGDVYGVHPSFYVKLFMMNISGVIETILGVIYPYSSYGYGYLRKPVNMIPKGCEISDIIDAVKNNTPIPPELEGAVLRFIIELFPPRTVFAKSPGIASHFPQKEIDVSASGNSILKGLTALLASSGKEALVAKCRKAIPLSNQTRYVREGSVVLERKSNQYVHALVLDLLYGRRLIVACILLSVMSSSAVMINDHDMIRILRACVGTDMFIRACLIAKRSDAGRPKSRAGVSFVCRMLKNTLIQEMRKPMFDSDACKAIIEVIGIESRADNIMKRTAIIHGHPRFMGHFASLHLED